MKPITGKELARALERHGWVLMRVKGSHHVLEHEDGRKTVVPVHAGESLGPGLIRALLRDCEMTAEELRELL